jgi:GR25 family glycosyltransferase involved in LPS biosynthesis
MSIKGYVINLKCRPDRLDRFNNSVKKYLPNIDIEVVEAINGNNLNLNDTELIRRVNKQNYHLTEKTFRGVIDCCLSHLECYKKIYESNEKYAMIFEDDCYFINGTKNTANDIIVNLKLPDKFGIIWFNECLWGDKLKTSSKPTLIPYKGCKTTESYLISKEFAKILYYENINNIGAIDHRIGLLGYKYSDYPYYTIDNDIFIQYDRSDSNIR